MKAEGEIDRDVCGKTESLKVSFPLYNLNCSFLCQWTILSHTNSLIYWPFLWLITSHSFKGLWCFLGKFKGFQVLWCVFLYLAGNVPNISPKYREETYISSIFTSKVKLPHHLGLNVTKFVLFRLYLCRDGTGITDHT